MGMFPVFLFGLVLGGIAGYACTNAYYIRKQDIPSEAKIHIQEARIIALTNDVENLETENKRLNEELLKKKQAKPKTTTRKTTTKKKKEE